MTVETAPVTVPLETVTPIKPSEAIRLGCLLRPIQCTGDELLDDDKACAWGALRIGYGDDSDAIWAATRMLDLDVECPGDNRKSFAYDGLYHDNGPIPVTWAIKHLNDGYCMESGHVGWSRERIADWLEGLGL